MHNIAIVGCGIIGLTTATVIQNKLQTSAKITIFAENVTPNTTSDLAAGLWGPYLMENTSEEKIQQWGKDTHEYFLQLWKNGFASEAGITMQLVKSVSETDKDIIDYPDIVLGMQDIKPEELERLKKHNKKYKLGHTFMTFTCEPAMHLPFLQKKFIARGGIIKEKKIYDITELSDYDIVVNCTGLGSKELLKDTNMVPIRGQIARVSAPWQFHIVLTDSGYVIPNCNSVVLGGTHQVNDDNLNVCQSDATKILDDCYTLVPSLMNAPILFHKVGLRPARTQLRLELETVYVRNKRLLIVHNYGHGGAGVTLSYGCALEACDLVMEGLRSLPKSKL